MQPVDAESSPPEPSSRIRVVAAALVVVLLAVVFLRWRRKVARGAANLAEEGVVVLTDAIIDELFAAS
jgi:hypothetical protein